MTDILLSGLLARQAGALFPDAKMEWVDAPDLRLAEDGFGMSVVTREPNQLVKLLRVSRLDDADLVRLARIETAYQLSRNNIAFVKDGENRTISMPISIGETAPVSHEAEAVLNAVADAQSDGLARAIVIGAGYRLAAFDLAKKDVRGMEYTHAGSPSDFVELQREPLYTGFYNFERFRYRHKRFDGSTSELTVRDMLVSGDAVVVLPYDPVRDEVVLIEQMRPAALSRGIYDAWELEAVAGVIGQGEAPEYTAARELEEEAGLAAGALYPIAPCYQSPGSVSQFMYLYIAKVDLSEYQAGIFGLDDEHEDIRTHVLSREAAIGLLKTGEANNAPLQILLYALALELEEIRCFLN